MNKMGQMEYWRNNMTRMCFLALLAVCSQAQAFSSYDHGWQCAKTDMADGNSVEVQSKYVVKGDSLVDADASDRFSILQNDANGMVAVKVSKKPFEKFKGVYADVLLISARSGQLSISRVDINDQMSMSNTNVVTHTGMCTYF
jgi:hypothetical protein